MRTAGSLQGLKGEPDIYERSNLTKNQLLIWLGQKLQPEVPLYNVAVTFTFSKKIEPTHFQNALQTLVNSSDALRTVIEETDGVPQQKVLDSLPYEMECLDFSALSDPQAAYEDWLRARCRALFDFRRCLFDSALVKIAEERFIWYWNQHHIVTDGQSVLLVYDYVSEFYERALNGCLEEIVALPRFRDYIEYEREQRDSPRYAEAEAYWKRKLAEKPDPLNIGGAAYVKRTSGIERLSCDLGLERTQKLKALAASEEISGASQHASLFHIFVAILFTYLYRITGNRRLSIGAPFHNRTKTFKDTLGLIMEVFPLQITIEPGDSFLSVITKVRAEMSEIRRFRGVALANPQNDKAYDVLLNYHTTTFPKFQGVPVQHQWIHTARENDALALQVHDFEGTGSLVLDFDFSCDVFHEEQRRQAMRHFLQLFDAFVEDPSRPLHSVSLLTQEERHRILVEWNDTKRAYPKNKCVHELFEQQVERTPDAVGVVFGDKQLTYRELNHRANQVAHYLKKLGVGPEALVGLYVERSPEMVVGLLGILKAGGAYVPLDAGYPDERVAFMWQDACIAVLLTQRRLAAGLPKGGPRTICLDTDWQAVALENEANPAHSAKPDNLAYVIYTSGSTGNPKGVLIEHRQILNYVKGISERLNLEPGAAFAMVQPLSVDSSQTVIFPSLISGGCLHVMSEEKASDPQALSEYFYRFPIDLLKIAPSHLAALQTSSRPEQLLPRRWLIIGGEVSRWDWMDKLQAMASCSIFNHYGPTEATVGMLTYQVEQDQNARSSSAVPIGRPLPNTQAFLLDRHMQPVPVGVAGELHIGGSCLARGYLNRPELTAEKFVRNPFSDDPQARLYKTGDLARYLPDGNIEFLGRTDNQVKIRGFRVELGEIEAMLAQHPAVRDAVILHKNGSDNPSAPLRTDTRLVAYVVPKRQPSPTAIELRGFLKQKLPDYMVPASFMLLDALPRTPHGKVDRQALPAPDPAGPELDGVEPRSPLEKALASIWTQVLGLERVGVHDNFFDLGGHSLLATQVVSRAREVYRIEISLRNFFETPTIAGIADLIQQAKQRGAESPMPKISRIPRQSHRMKSPL